MTNKNSPFEIQDNIQLLDRMLSDMMRQTDEYRPGPYWAAKVRNAAAEIKRQGLSDFRGASNTIGASFTDSFVVDTRDSWRNAKLSKRITSFLASKFMIGRLFDQQTALTRAIAFDGVQRLAEIANLQPRTAELLANYSIPFSLLGGCIAKAEIQGKEYATHYLNLLEQIDNISKKIDLTKISTVFEIGGGFGTTIHLLLENFNNIRKVVYLDIPPNLYVGTQYLKAFFPENVKDYEELAQKDSITFSNDDSLEILCIPPWQIENFSDTIDLFINSHSFVEIPENTVQNYANHVLQFPNAEKTAIALTTYDRGHPKKTLKPEQLPEFFTSRSFTSFEATTLFDSTRKTFTISRMERSNERDRQTGLLSTFSSFHSQD